MKQYPFLDLGRVNARYAEALRSAGERVIASGRYVGGEEVDALECWLSGITGARYCVGVSNGLDALRLILEGYKVLGRLHVGDVVMVPANTYVASLLAISEAGLRPFPVDPDMSTMNLNAEGAARAMTPDVKAIMTVHLYGRVACDNELHDLAADNGLLLIEDAAQAIGAKGAGGLGDAAGFSFYPTKNMGALGDGGAVTTSDPRLAKAVRMLANYGSDYRYHNVYKGHNCRLDPLQAALIMAKSDDLDGANDRRRKRAEMYSKVIANRGVITPVHPVVPEEHVWHQYVVRVPGFRDRFRDYLASNGVSTDIHYATPPHKQPCYAELSGMHLPVTECLADEVVSLPISDCTSLQDVVEISNIINTFTY